MCVKYPHIQTGHTAVSKYPKVVTNLYPSSQLTWLGYYETRANTTIHITNSHNFSNDLGTMIVFLAYLV